MIPERLKDRPLYQGYVIPVTTVIIDGVPDFAFEPFALAEAMHSENRASRTPGRLNRRHGTVVPFRYHLPRLPRPSQEPRTDRGRGRRR